MIKYANKSLYDICQNEKKFNKKYNCIGLYKSFSKQIRCLSAPSIKNIKIAQKNVGLNIEKLQSHKNSGSFRLNKSWRIIFTYSESLDFLLIASITIKEINNHKYQAWSRKKL